MLAGREDDFFQNAIAWGQRQGRLLGGAGRSVAHEVIKLAKTPTELRAYLDTLGFEGKLIAKEIFGVENPTGAELYRYLTNQKSGYERAASSYLWDWGIPGAVFSSNKDLHSVVPAPNALIWAKELLE